MTLRASWYFQLDWDNSKKTLHREVYRDLSEQQTGNFYSNENFDDNKENGKVGFSKFSPSAEFFSPKLLLFVEEKLKKL